MELPLEGVSENQVPEEPPGAVEQPGKKAMKWWWGEERAGVDYQTPLHSDVLRRVELESWMSRATHSLPIQDRWKRHE